MSGPLITTKRLELWQPVATDLAGLHELTLDDETRRFLGKHKPAEVDSFSRLMRNAGSWALHGYGTFMVRRRGAVQIIGNCGIFRSLRGFGKGLDDVPEAGWIIDRNAWGEGLAGEAMRASLAWFDKAHGAQRIACMIEQDHAVSDRLAAALGFVRYDSHVLEDGATVNLYERVGLSSDVEE
jgi:RimJ/RimL family protein N-acetyltransferase